MEKKNALENKVLFKIISNHLVELKDGFDE